MSKHNNADGGRSKWRLLALDERCSNWQVAVTCSDNDVTMVSWLLTVILLLLTLLVMLPDMAATGHVQGEMSLQSVSSSWYQWRIQSRRWAAAPFPSLGSVIFFWLRKLTVTSGDKFQVFQHRSYKIGWNNLLLTTRFYIVIHLMWLGGFEQS